jgi:hypothetical protein
VPLKLVALIAALTSAALGVLSTGALTLGTRSTPHDILSWGGRSEPEQEFRRVTHRWLVGGLVLLGIAFLFGAASALCSYFSS